MTILIVNDSTEECPEDFLQNWIGLLSNELFKKKLISEEQNKKELSVVFLDEKDAKRINWQYRSKDYPTDVLSFETDDPDAIGELVMCPQVLKKQATDNKLTYENEITRMIVHGVLHLLGYDHELSPEADKKMMLLQEQILTALEPAPKKRNLTLVKAPPAKAATKSKTVSKVKKATMPKKPQKKVISKKKKK
ncbi:MAG: rRNA maturation RNase YbeY [Bdellovibrionota bacterium]